MIKKVVFPVAGLGTRFLPATKSIPKEMLPIVDKPLIHYAIEEAIEAGAETLIFITGKNKGSIEDYFDRDLELERKLQSNNKTSLLEIIQDIIPPGITCVYLRQFEPAGLGHAVLCAEPVIDGEPFGVILADDMIYSQGKRALAQLSDVSNQHHCGVVAIEQVPREDVQKYGIIDGARLDEKTWQLSSVIEKPTSEETSGDLAIIGRYILMPDIFDILGKTPKGVGGEIQLTDALNVQIQSGNNKMLAYRFSGKRFDCGNRIGYMKANIEMGLQHPDIGEELKKYLAEDGVSK